jgi:hypothetical protein
VWLVVLPDGRTTGVVHESRPAAVELLGASAVGAGCMVLDLRVVKFLPRRRHRRKPGEKAPGK